MFGTYSSLRLLSPRTSNCFSFNKISPISFTYTNHTTHRKKKKKTHGEKFRASPEFLLKNKRNEEGEKGNV